MLPVFFLHFMALARCRGICESVFAEESPRALVTVELSVDVSLRARGGEDPTLHVQLGARGPLWLCVDLAPSLDLGTCAFLGVRVSRCRDPGWGKPQAVGRTRAGIARVGFRLACLVGISKCQLLQGKGQSLPFAALSPVARAEPSTQ